MAKKLTKRQLVAAYKELDTVIGVDPPIDYEDLSVEEFARELLETVEELVEPGDKFSDSTQAIFDQLKDEPEEPEEEPEEKEEPDDEPEEDDKEDDEQDDEPEPEEKPRKRSAKPVKEEKVKSEKKASTTERVEFVTNLIQSNKKLTKKDILEKMCEKFPSNSRSAHATILSDGKNPKYCKFEKLLIEDDGGVLSFVESPKK
jgi:outer membrane biosynthesis protein TonB